MDEGDVINMYISARITNPIGLSDLPALQGDQSAYNGDRVLAECIICLQADIGKSQRNGDMW